VLWFVSAWVRISCKMPKVGQRGATTSALNGRNWPVASSDEPLEPNHGKGVCLFLPYRVCPLNVRDLRHRSLSPVVASESPVSVPAHRHLAQAHPSRVEHCVANRRSQSDDGRLSGTGRWQVGPVQKMNVEFP
jgi:hypothetical protein